MLNNFNKYINFNIFNNFNKNKNKYIKINTKNIYNYLTRDNILYINNKINSKNIYPVIYTNLLYSIKISIKSWLIKDKNILLVYYNINNTNILIIFNINNLDDIKIYKYYLKLYQSLLNDINVYYNKSLIIINYFNQNKTKYKYIEPNYIIIFYKFYYIFYTNYKKYKILDTFRQLKYTFYYINYKIYINLNISKYIYLYNNLLIIKIKLILI